MPFIQNFTPGSEIRFQGYVGRIQNRQTPKGKKVCNISSSEGVNGNKTWVDVTVWGHLDTDKIGQNAKFACIGHSYPQARYRYFPDTPMKTDSEAFQTWLKDNPPLAKLAINAKDIFIFKDDGEIEQLSIVE